MPNFEIALPAEKTWLITGGNGFIGSHLVEFLLKNNQKVVALDHSSLGKKTNIEAVLETLSPQQRQNLTLVEGDIRDFEVCLKATQGVNYILHQAALASISKSLEDPLTTTQVNVMGTLALLQAARQNQVDRVVYASSSAVYGDTDDLPPQETEVGIGLSPYGLSKYLTELYAQGFGRWYSLPTVGLRYFNVFGPRQNASGPYPSVIPIWMQSLLKGGPCYINGDGLTSRDFCYVDNVVQANIRAALGEEKAVCGHVFNIGFGQTTTLLDLYALLKKALKIETDISPEHRPERLGDIKHSRANIDKAKNLLGYVPTHSLEEGLALTAAWAQQSI